MKPHAHLFALLSLLVTIGCFATPKQVQSPALAHPKAPEEPPSKTASIADLNAHLLFSWEISGDSPTATWSPDQTLLALSTDDPKDNTKLLYLLDATSGAVKSATRLQGGRDFPQWVSDSMLGLFCEEERCGEGKSGHRGDRGSSFQYKR